MLAQTWFHWCQNVKMLTGMTQRDDDMMSLWSQFLSTFTTPEEAWVAVTHVMRANPPAFRSDLLTLVIKQINRGREEARKKEEAITEPNSELCGVCNGFGEGGFPRPATGFVRVPDHRHLAEKRTYRVYCRCKLGNYFRMRRPSVTIDGVEKFILTIDEVDRIFDDIPPAVPGGLRGWKGYIDLWKEQQREEIRQRETARSADKRLGPLQPKNADEIIAKLAERWRMPQGDE